MTKGTPTPRRVNRYRHLLGGVALFSSMLAFIPFAAAQTAGQGGSASGSDNFEEVVVTGSSIRGAPPTGSAVSTVSREDIEATGATTTTELLRSLPQVGSFNSTGNNIGNNQANFVDQPAIHGIGVGNGGGGLTLVLFDGMRLPGAGINQTAPDPSAIPSSALERVEVIADGASSIYGSDAIAGVINFIPRRDYDGAETHAQVGFGDSYRTQDFSQLFGKTWQGGSVLMDYEHSQNTDLTAGNRSYTSDNGTAKGFGDLRVSACNPANFSVGGNSYGLTSTGSAVLGATNKCESHANDDLYPAQYRDQGLISLRQHVTDDIELFATELYSARNINDRISSNSPQLTPGGNNFSVTVPASSPFYIPVPGGNGASESVIYNPGGSFSNRISTATQDLTFGGEVKLWGDWRVKATGDWGLERDQVAEHGINETLATDAALAGTLNPFGVGTATSASLMSAINNYQTLYAGDQQVLEGTIKADGTLVMLPGGAVKAALGFDIRHESFSAFNSVGPVGTTAGLTAAEAAVSTTSSLGQRDSKAVFGEFLIPIVGEGNRMDWIRSLNLSLAARYDHYSDVGGTTNPKVGATYSPFEGLSFRGSYGTSFHAPSLADASTAIDTRAIRFADFVYGNPNDYSIILAGGKKLQPETADTYSAGFDWKPAPVSGLTLSPTFFQIDYHNVITFPTFNPVTEPNNSVYDAYRVYLPTLAQAEALTAGFRHDGNFNLATQLPTAIYDLRRQNFADEYIRGLDFNASYLIDGNDLGFFNVGLAGTWLWEFNQQIKGATTTNVLLNTDYAIDFKARASFGWDKDAYSGAVFVNYTNGYDNAATNGLGTQRVSSFTTVDLHGSWQVPFDGILTGTKLTVDVSNLFDTNPPYYYNTNGINGVDITAASPLGRVVSIGLNKKW